MIKSNSLSGILNFALTNTSRIYYLLSLAYLFSLNKLNHFLISSPSLVNLALTDSTIDFILPTSFLIASSSAF